MQLVLCAQHRMLRFLHFWQLYLFGIAEPFLCTLWLFGLRLMPIGFLLLSECLRLDLEDAREGFRRIGKLQLDPVGVRGDSEATQDFIVNHFTARVNRSQAFSLFITRKSLCALFIC